MAAELPAGGAADPSAAARGRLGAFDIGCVVVGGIIGVGIFFTPAKVAARVDTPTQVLVAWGLGGALAVLGALVFAQLVRLVPEFGGTFVYIRRAFGAFPAFLYGWANWLVIQSGALAVISLVLVQYAAQMVHGAGYGVGAGSKVLIGAAAILLFTLLNVLGLRVGKRVQNTLTVAKVAAVFGLVCLGLASAAPTVVAAPARPVQHGWLAAMAGAMLPVLFAFGGWQQGSFVAGAARNPLRDVPLGILGGVAVVVLAYVTVNLTFLDLLGFEGAARSEAIALDATQVALEPHGLGDAAARVLGAMVVLSALGILNTICMAPPYVLHAMAKQGLFFPAAARLHPTFGSPALAVLVQGGFGVVLLLGAYVASRGVAAVPAAGGAADAGVALPHASAKPADGTQDMLGFLLDGVVFVDWLFFGLCGLALLRLWAGAPPGARMPGARTVAVLFSALGFAVAIGAFWTSRWPSVAGLAILAAGIPFYLWMRRTLRPHPQAHPEPHNASFAEPQPAVAAPDRRPASREMHRP